MAKRIVDEEMRFSIVVNGDPAQKELHETAKATKDLTQKNSKLRTEKRRLERQNKTSTKRYKEVNKEIKQNSAVIKKNNLRMNQLEDKIGVTNLTMAQLQKRAAALRQALRHSVPGTTGYKRLQADLQKTNAQMTKARAKSKGLGSSIGKLASGFNKFAVLGGSVIAGITGVVFSIQKFIDFNAKLADAQSAVQKTTNLTKQEVDDLAKSFGALNTRSSRIELLKLSEEAGRLGIRGVQNIKDFTEVANRMNVALQDDLSTEQIREVGKLSKIFKVAEKEGLSFAKAFESVGSAINEVSASGANQAGFLVDFSKRLAGIGASANLSAEQVIGMGAAFDELGQRGETSATAVGKTLIAMAEDTEKFAEIAGLNVEEFTRLFREDANEALLVFLDAVDKGDADLKQMADRMEDLELGGNRGVAAITALAKNTDLLRKRQEKASESLKENTSLTKEYNLKNENFAAIIDKIQKKFMGLIAASKSFIEPLVRGFGDLIGVSQDHVRELQNEQLELNRLKVRLFNVNTDQEKRVKIINRLQQEYPEYLSNIDAEKATTKELRTALNQVNEELINKIILQKQQQKVDEQNEDIAEKELDAAQRKVDLENKVAEIIKRQDGFKLDPEKSLTENAARLIDFIREENPRAKTIFSQAVRDTRSLNIGIKNVKATEAFLNTERKRGNQLLDERQKLLKTLGIDENKDGKSDSKKPDGPKEGDKKFFGDIEHVYKNGSWVPIKKDNPAGGSNQQEIDTLKDLVRQKEDARLQAMREGIEKQLALEDLRFSRVKEKLEAQLTETEKIDELINSGKDKQANKLLAKNAAINDQLESQDKIHKNKRAEILQQGVDEYISSLKSEFKQEQNQREQAHLDRLAELQGNEKAIKAEKEKFRKENLEAEKEHMRDVKQELDRILADMDFKGFDISILSEEQLQTLKNRLQELGLSIKQIDNLLNNLGKGGKDKNSLNSVDSAGIDILGYTPDQWRSLFENWDSAADAVGKVGMVIGATSEAFSMFHDAQMQRERMEMDRFRSTQEQKQKELRRRLDLGLINERQYNDAVQALEEKRNKKEAKMRYKQAKRQKALNIADITANGAVAVSKALAEEGILGIPLAAIIGSMIAAQLAIAASTPLPAKGFEQGLYGQSIGDTAPVQRQQDGKNFNARFGGTSTSGIVDQPSVFLAGEQGKSAPEMIISGGDWANFDPGLQNAITAEVARVRGFEDGFYQSQTNKPNFDTEKDDLKDDLMIELMTKLNRQLDQGIEAKVMPNEKNAREMEEMIQKFKERKQNAQR